MVIKLYHIQENMENDNIIYDEIIDYIESKNYLLTGFGDKEYLNLIKKLIIVLNYEKNKYYFFDSIKSLFSDYTFIHYEKCRVKKASIIKDIIFN